jgi:protein TonB
MLNEKLLRPLIFIFAAALHVVLLLFLAFKIDTVAQQPPENARVMKLLDIDEAPPPPPPPPPPTQREALPNEVETIAENMIETDTPPDQIVVAAGTLTNVIEAAPVAVVEEYQELGKLSKPQPPQFDTRSLAADLVDLYPPIPLRSGMGGRVILELFVDRTGTVQKITILLEDPKDRGFGDAAVKAFSGRKGTPATANGEAVSVRYRYPVTFKTK